MEMIQSIQGKAPNTEQAAFVAPSADLCGEVTLAKDASVWYGAVLRADTGTIRVGEGSNIQDLACLHTGPGLDILIGSGVSVGHSAVIHGCVVEDQVLIGMHATLLNGCRIGKGSIIAAGALVPENAQIPPGSLVMGIPGRVVRPVSPELAQGILDNREEYLRLARLHAGEPLLDSVSYNNK